MKIKPRRTKHRAKAAIKRSCGLLERKPGEKQLRQWWSDYKKEEKALERQSMPGYVLDSFAHPEFKALERELKIAWLK